VFRGAQRRDPDPCTNLLAAIVLNILKLDDPELRQARAQARQLSEPSRNEDFGQKTRSFVDGHDSLVGTIKFSRLRF
jgi:hypothetical protein